jgi:hypothetical protein
VDGFPEDHNAFKTDDCFEADFGLVTSKRDPFEALQFADRLFDAVTGFAGKRDV